MDYLSYSWFNDSIKNSDQKRTLKRQILCTVYGFCCNAILLHNLMANGSDNFFAKKPVFICDISIRPLEVSQQLIQSEDEIKKKRRKQDRYTGGRTKLWTYPSWNILFRIFVFRRCRRFSIDWRNKIIRNFSKDFLLGDPYVESLYLFILSMRFGRFSIK